MIECYQGDTQDWRWKLTRDGQALSQEELSGASATLTIEGLGITDAPLIIEPTEEYPIVYRPNAGDTLNASGVYTGTITVTFSDGQTETWPVSVRVREK